MSLRVVCLEVDQQNVCQLDKLAACYFVGQLVGDERVAVEEIVGIDEKATPPTLGDCKAVGSESRRWRISQDHKYLLANPSSFSSAVLS